jgi:hypothetical protein
MRVNRTPRQTFVLLDDLGRSHGWTADAAKAVKVEHATRPYRTWADMPPQLRRALVVAGFEPTPQGGDHAHQ